MTPDPADPLGVDPILAARARWAADDHTREFPAVPIDQMAPADLDDAPPLEPAARTAGDQDHSNPWAYAGDDADAPVDTGRPPGPDVVLGFDPAPRPDAFAIMAAERSRYPQRIVLGEPEPDPGSLAALVAGYVLQYRRTFGADPLFGSDRG